MKRGLYILFFAFLVISSYSQSARPVVRAYKAITSEFVEPLNGDILLRGAIRAMVDSLDGYTTYLTSEQYEALKTAKGRRISVPVAEIVGDSVGYIKVDNFNRGAAADLVRAYKELKHMGARSIVLDFRDNGGGVMSECLNAASIFLPLGKVVTHTEGRKAEYDDSFYTRASINDNSTPLAVLVGPRSASGAEMFVGAIQDYKRGVVIGSRTYGKGVGQRFIAVGGGSYLSLTVVRYFTPVSRRSFDHKTGGLEVDIAVPESLYVGIDNIKDDKAIICALQTFK